MRSASKDRSPPRSVGAALAAIGSLLACTVVWGCGASSSGESVPPSERPPAPATGRQLNPNVVGPRLVRESYGAQLRFWLRTYGARDHARAVSSWATADRGRVVTLQLRRGDATPSSLTARWKIAVPLDRDLTPRQLEALGGPGGIVPANGTARRLSSFPRVDPARGPRSRPLALVARVQDVDLRKRRIAVGIVPAESVLDGLVTRRGRDLALLAGLTLTERAPLPPLTTVVLAPKARIVAGSQSLTPSRLDAIVARAPEALVVLSWRRAGSLSLAKVLARPVDRIELVVAPN